MADPTLYGPAYSTYVRACRLALAEKGVGYRLHEVDFLQGMPEEQKQRHPFGKVPAFEHDGFALYETLAICRYVDEAFDGPALQPSDARGRARMTQLVQILDAYTYGPCIGTIVIQRLVVPKLGGAADEEAVKAALPDAERALTVIDDLAGSSEYLAGASPSLADLHLVPIYDYFRATPEGESVLGKTASLRRWWDAIGERESVVETRPSL